LFDERAIIASVTDDVDPQRGASVVAFGASVFVTDGFMTEARGAREPYLTNRLIQRELSGSTSPVLRPKSIARANAEEGLNVIIIHAGAPRERAYAIRHSLRESFIWSHRGYHIKEILQEVWDDVDREWVQAWGALRGDYSDYYCRMRSDIPAYRPFLIGLTAEEALTDPGSLASAVFLFNPPRFRFSEGAQDLLMRAMDGETDAVVASTLHISLPAVKMRWRTIYDQVEAVTPELLPEPIHVPPSARGHEKRRSIIEYVRSHPEELRPFAPALGRHSKRAISRHLKIRN